MSLSTSQLQVLAYIATGATAVVAARVAGVHRNTVGNWLHNDEFRTALREARERKAVLFEDQAEIVAAEAFAALRAIASDPKAAPSVRLRAAVAMLDRAAMAPPPVPAAFPNPQENLTPVHNDAQLPIASATPNDAQPATATPPHNHAQPAVVTPLRSTKVGRNARCPCGSGLKYKRCCVGKTAVAA